MGKEKTSILLIVLAAILWGTTGVSLAYAPSHTNPISFGAIRLLIGSICLLLYVLIRKEFTVTNMNWKLLMVAGLFNASYQPFFFYGVKLTGVSIGTVVAIGSAPIFAGVLEKFLNKNKLSPLWFNATLFAIIGCVFLNDVTAKEDVNVWGIIFALGSGLSFAIYTFCTQKAFVNQNANNITTIIFLISAVFLLPTVFVFPMDWLFTTNGMYASLFIGIFATCIAYILFTKGLQHVSSSTAVTLSLVEPLSAVVIGLFFLHEAFTVYTFIGFLCMMVSLGLLSIPTKPKHKRKRNFSINVE